MYNFNDFYVGVVKCDDILQQEKDVIKHRTQQIADITEGGGIPFCSTRTGTIPDSVLTIFYKTCDDKYVCLHNLKEYSNNCLSFNYCNQLISFDKLLTSKLFNYPSLITIQQARDLFKSLYKKKKDINYLEKELDINSLFVGKFIISEFDLNNDKKLEKINVPQLFLLDNSYSRLLGTYTRSKRDLGYNDEDTIARVFRIYESIFYKPGEHDCYNINNFKKYIDGTRMWFMFIDDENLCFDMQPLKESIDIKNKQDMSMQKVLRYQKKMNNTKK